MIMRIFGDDSIIVKQSWHTSHHEHFPLLGQDYGIDVLHFKESINHFFKLNSSEPSFRVNIRT